MRLLLPGQRQLEPDDLLDLYADDRSPCVRAGFVLSVDGAVALDGGSRALQTPADLASFRALRGVADAVVVGAGTARSEGYGPVRHTPAARAWREARGLGPARLVLVSRSLDLDPSTPAFTDGARPVVVTCASATASPALHEAADLLVAGDDAVDLVAAVGALHQLGLGHLLCEGGPQLLTGLLGAGLVDELFLTLSPLLVGGAPGLLTEALPTAVHLELAHLVDGQDGSLLARYRIT